MDTTREAPSDGEVPAPDLAVETDSPCANSSAPSNEHGTKDCTASNIADETGAQETFTQGQTGITASGPVQDQTCLNDENHRTDRRDGVNSPTPEKRDRLTPLQRIRARAASIGKRFSSISQVHRRPQPLEQVDAQDQRKESNTFVEALWSGLQHLRPRRVRRKKQGPASSRAALPITLVDNDILTPENPPHHHQNQNGSDDESDGNFSAIEIFDQEYSEERPGGSRGPDGRGLRMVRYIPREEASGSSEGTSAGAGQDLIYVPYSPGCEPGDTCESRQRSKES